MHPPIVIHAADELRALLRDDSLPRLGLVDVGKGSRLSFELAVRVTLTDFARLSGLAKNGYRIEADRMWQVSEDLERLHRMAITAPLEHPSTRVPRR